MRCSVFIAASLDGFIAREDGALDWLPGADVATSDPGIDHDLPEVVASGYDAWFGSLDALVLGRASFEAVLGFDVGWPYAGVEVVVLSERGVTVPDALARAVRVDAGTPAEIVARLAADGHHVVGVDGGLTIQGFLAEDLIDDLIVSTVPVLLGSGRRLFGPVASDLWFEPMGSKDLSDGMTQTTWRRRRD